MHKLMKRRIKVRSAKKLLRMKLEPPVAEEMKLSEYKNWIKSLSGEILKMAINTCMVHCAIIFVETYSVLSESEHNTLLMTVL